MSQTYPLVAAGLPLEDDAAEPIMFLAAESCHLLVIESNVDHAVGVCGNVSMYLFRRHTVQGVLPAVQRAFQAARDAGEGRFANFGLIEAQATLPEGEMRARLARVMRDAAPDMVVSSLTFEGIGFRASAVRTVAMGMALMARQPYLHRVFGSIAVASDWMATQMHHRAVRSPEPRLLQAAMSELRAA